LHRPTGTFSVLISQKYGIPVCRTGIYRHSPRDLVRATRKIEHANEPVVHDKHQPCNSNACSA